MSHLLSRLRRRASFANVTSAAALFIALGGTSYAAITLPSNSVGSDQIRTGAVGTSEIRTGGVSSPEIKTSGVRSSEIATGAVGAAEIHTDAVRAKEIQTGAVTGDEVKDGSLEAADLSDAAKSSLAGVPAFRTAVNTTGAQAAGNATAASRTAAGVYTVDFGKDVSACFYEATLAQVKNGATSDTPDAGRVTVAPGTAATSVVVRTFGVAGNPNDEPFHLIVSC